MNISTLQRSDDILDPSIAQTSIPERRARIGLEISTSARAAPHYGPVIVERSPNNISILSFCTTSDVRDSGCRQDRRGMKTPKPEALHQYLSASSVYLARFAPRWHRSCRRNGLSGLLCVSTKERIQIIWNVARARLLGSMLFWVSIVRQRALIGVRECRRRPRSRARFCWIATSVSTRQS